VSKNRLRKLIVNFFRERECMTLVRPAEEENVIVHTQTNLYKQEAHIQ
jgi:hypothetical protein